MQVKLKMDSIQLQEINCICNNKFDIKTFKKHYKKCSSIKKRFTELDNQINSLLKKYSKNEKELTIVIFFFKRYIKRMKSFLKKFQTEIIKHNEKESKINENEIKISNEKKVEIQINNGKQNEIKNNNNLNIMNHSKNLDNDKLKKTTGNEFFPILSSNNNNNNKNDANNNNGNNNFNNNNKDFLINYSQGQVKGGNNNLALSSNFQSKANNKIINQVIPLQMGPQNNIIQSNTDINNQKNTSLIRVFQCLSEIFKNEISLKNTRDIFEYVKKYKPISITTEIINIIDLLNNYSQQININYFNKIFTYFRTKYSMKIQKFQGNDEISPKFVFHELFSYFNNEMKEYDIPWNNLLLDKLIDPIVLPRNKFPEVYKRIEFIKNNFASLFVDFFYFMLLDLVKCTNCFQIINAQIYLASFFELDSYINTNVANLMKNILLSRQNTTYQRHYCDYCRCYTLGIYEKKFLNSPKYLIIDFCGETKNYKYLDNEIDLSNFIISNIGPRKFKLYGYISQAQNGKFILYIRGNNCWKVYSEENKFETNNIDNLNTCNPYIAIYQGSQ